MTLQFEVWPRELVEQLAGVVGRMRARGVGWGDVRLAIADIAAEFTDASRPEAAPEGLVQAVLDAALDGIPITAATAISPRPDRLDLLVSRGGHVLAHRSGDAGDRDRWDVLDAGLDVGIRSLAASSAAEHHLEVFELSESGAVFHRWWTESSGWSPPSVFRGSADPGAVALATWSRADGHQEVAVATTENLVLHRWRLDHGPWSNWRQLGALDEDVVALAACAANPDHQEVWAVGASGDLHHTWWSQADDWADWHRMAPPVGFVATSIASLTRRGGSTQELFLADAEGRIATRRHDRGWEPWEELTAAPAGIVRLAVAAASPDEAEIVATLVDGRLSRLALRSDASPTWRTRR